MIPPKITTTAQGEPVLYDIDVKGGENNSGALVAINAKGGDCWQMYYRNCKLVIDGKYSSNDGLSTTPMINRKEYQMIKGNTGKYNSEDGRIRVCIDGKIGTT